MLALIEAIQARLLGDSALTSKLGTLQNNAPAVVLAEPYPEILPLPFVAIGGVITRTARDTKTTSGWDIQLDLRFFSRADGDIGLIEGIAERGRALFNGVHLTVGSDTTLVAVASGPHWIPAESDNLYGRSVPLRFVIA